MVMMMLRKLVPSLYSVQQYMRSGSRYSLISFLVLNTQDIWPAAAALAWLIENKSQRQCITVI